MRDWIVGQLEVSHGNHARLRSMEGLRGIAVFLVFLVHYSSLIEPWLATDGWVWSLRETVHSFGNSGVDLFFVLSGYLIYGTILSKKEFRFFSYLKRRIVRIYPTFLLVFAVYLALSFVFPSESRLPAGAGDRYLYVSANLLLMPGLFDIEPIITVAWSLSFEFFYYLLIPIVIFGFRLQKWSCNQRIGLWLVVAAVGFTYFSLVPGHVRLLMFVSGILLFEATNYRELQLRHGGTFCLIAALALFGLQDALGLNFVFVSAGLFVFFFVLCLEAFTANTFASRWLTLAPIRWLGNISYSYYLIHGLTLRFLFLVLGAVYAGNSQHEWLYFWLWMPCLIATLVSSFALFVLVERPLSLTNRPVPLVSPPPAHATPFPAPYSAQSAGSTDQKSPRERRQRYG